MSGYRLLAESHPTARKAHRCIWCGEPIPVGEKYRRERSVYDGEMQDHAWHPECMRAAQHQFTRTGDCEFEPHDNERGEVAPAFGG